MDRLEYFEGVKQLIAEKHANEAANAIRGCIATLTGFELCSLDEFLCLIDLDHSKYWGIIADNIAIEAEREIRNGNLHPNELKPWLNCVDYPAQFAAIAGQNEWRQLHGALNTIVGRISARFRC